MAKSTGSEGTRDGGRNNPSGGGSRADPKSDRDIARDRKGAEPGAQGGRAISNAHKSATPGGTRMVGNDTTATVAKAKAAGVSPQDYEKAVGAYADRVRDELDTDNSFIENVGNLIGGFFGFDEQVPDFDVNNLSPKASWGLDPVQALANFAGMATGFPVGTGYAGLKAITGWTGPQIDMGESVIGEDDPLNKSGGKGFTAGNFGDGPAVSGPSSAGAKDGAGNDKGGKGNGNGLLPQEYLNSLPPAIISALQSNGKLPTGSPAPTPPQQAPSPTPTPTPTPAEQPSRFPTPSQKFQSQSYWAGDWVFNDATQKVEWRPYAQTGAYAQNGLLAA